MTKLAFYPSRHGYHFSNTFVNRILPGVLNGVSTSGLCGGMVMSALDYWRAEIPVPLHATADFGPEGLPSEASALRRYIFDRQMNSLLTNLMFTRWITAPWIKPDDFHNWATGSEFEIVKNQIHMGRPTMLGLWSMSPGDATSGHQVLCYGYDNTPAKRLWIYDPNRPDEESTLTPISPAEGCVIEGMTTHTTSVYRGYFFTDVYNWGETPPYAPRYKDIVVSSGMSLAPANPGNPGVGKRLAATVTITNIGEYPSRFKLLYVWVRGPNGENLDPLLAGTEPGVVSIQPGESRTIVRTQENFGSAPGTYVVGVSNLTNHDHWINIPPVGVGARTSEAVTLWWERTQVVDTWVDVPESAKQDIDTGITLNPNDEYELTGTGQIWAGVWGTGLNGPEGWADRIETNPNSPMHNTPDSHPFSLIGRFGDSAHFYISHGLSRRAHPLSVSSALKLRTNDNSPGNGSGAFRCRVQVWR